ncbi:MAG: helix-turn-helix domain-containing protein [Elusimicrobiota bacterium]
MIENLLSVYDPALAKKLMTMKKAAEYLGIHPVSVRRLVSRGIVKPRYRVGRTVLLLQDDLDVYKLRGAKVLPNPPPWIERQLEASLSLKMGSGRTRAFKKLNGFAWEGIPFVRERIIKKHGDVPFEIRVDCFDESSWKITYAPKKKGQSRMVKFWKRDAWLVG